MENKSEIQSYPAEVKTFIKSLPKDKQQQATSIFMACQKSFSGPIPSPEDFQGYGQVLPSAPERILGMAEKQQNHRMEMERMIANRDLRLSERGQIFGFIITLLFLGAAILFALSGHDTIGIILLSTTLLGSIAVFVLQKSPWKGKENNTES